MLFGIRWGGLRAKIVAWSFVPTAIILGAAAFVTFAAYQQVTADLVIQRNQQLSRFSASQLATELTKYTDLLTAESRSTAIYAGEQAAQQSALNAAYNRLAVFDAGVVILNTRGRIVASYPESETLVGQNWASQRFFREMLHFPEPTFSNIVTLPSDTTEVIVVAVPILGNEGEFIGAMAGMFRLGATSISALYGDIVKLRIDVNCCAIMVDGNGRAIYHSMLSQVGADFSHLDVVQRALAGQIGAIRTSEIEGQDSVASFAPVPLTSWAIITQESWDKLLSAGQTYSQFLVILLILGLVVPGLVVAIGVRRITKPVSDLIEAAQRVADGDFSQTIQASTGDEIETLARQFNRMSARLQESYSTLETRVAERTRELAALNALATVVSRSLDLDTILSDALNKTLEVTGIESGGIYLINEHADALNIAVQIGLSEETTAEVNNLKIGEGFSGQVIQTGEALVVDDIAADKRLTRHAVVAEGFHALAIVPIASRGKLLGSLFVITRAFRKFSGQDIELMTSIGHQIAVAIENARLFKAEQRRAEQFRFISEVGRQIISILDTDDLLREIVQLLKKSFGYYLITIGLIEDDMVVFRAGKKDNWSHGEFCPAALKVGAQGITAWVAGSGEPLLVNDVEKDPRYLFWPDAAETRSELAVPLKTKSGVIGVLNVESTEVNGFDESDNLVLQSIAQQAAIAIENAQLFEQAQQLAVIQERQRLARDLHDSVTQALYGITLYAEAATRQLSQKHANYELAADHLHDLQGTAQEALREMRLLIFELRPPILEQEGLVAALRIRLDTVEVRSGVKVAFNVEGTRRPLPTKTEAGLYRIAQEALNNALKHSQATEIDVRLHYDLQGVTLEISDDGAGFDLLESASTGGFGLSGMRERATEMDGKLTIKSKPGHGTLIRAEVSQ